MNRWTMAIPLYACFVDQLIDVERLFIFNMLDRTKSGQVETLRVKIGKIGIPLVSSFCKSRDNM